jgi:hypothetical protein
MINLSHLQQQSISVTQHSGNNGGRTRNGETGAYKFQSVKTTRRLVKTQHWQKRSAKLEPLQTTDNSSSGRRGGRKEQHAPAIEIHSLARASHAPVRERLKEA